jgi:hypothetical protein
MPRRKLHGRDARAVQGEKRMTASILERAEALLRELLPTMPTTIRTRAELFLSRQGGRPRKVNRELCRRLRAEGVPVAEIAIRIG